MVRFIGFPSHLSAEPDKMWIAINSLDCLTLSLSLSLSIFDDSIHSYFSKSDNEKHQQREYRLRKKMRSHRWSHVWRKTLKACHPRRDFQRPTWFQLFIWHLRFYWDFWTTTMAEKRKNRKDKKEVSQSGMVSNCGLRLLMTGSCCYGSRQTF
jgi:hypothetical protein